MITLDESLAGLPTPSNRRIALHVKPAAERALRDGHPWLFEAAIRKQNHSGAPGDLAVVFDRKDRFLAVGLYDPDSQIRVKVLQHSQQANIDRVWYKSRLEAAVKLRASLNRAKDTNGYRLVYGENDGLPGFVVDRYAETLVVKLYSAVWFPHLRTMLGLLLEVFPSERVVVRFSRSVSGPLKDGQVVYGEPLGGNIEFLENGLTFSADVIHGHKTGFFFDQRDNRQRVAPMAAGAEVLDVFAYSGGFSVYAASGGATGVLSLDVSEPALAAAKHNMALNRAVTAGVQHDVWAIDAFAGLQSMVDEPREFDLVIIDPPSFAKRQSEVPHALNAYRKLAELGTKLVKPNGQFVMASCSSRVSADDFFRAVQESVAHSLKNVLHTGHAQDHPVTFAEGEYLKCLFATVE